MNTRFARLQRGRFIDTLYSILNATKAEKLSELSEDRLKNAVIILYSFNNIDEKSRRLVFQTLFLLFQAVTKNLLLFIPALSSDAQFQTSEYK